MHLLKFDRGYSRRHFLKQATQGAFTAGVLMPTWEAIAAGGDISKAYPDELLSIEGYTKGKIKTGDEINASNVDLVKNLLEPIRYEQILKNGRKLKIAKTTTDVMRLSPWEYIEATLANQGKAKFDATGNIVNAANGQPWIGGNPAMKAKVITMKAIDTAPRRSMIHLAMRNRNGKLSIIFCVQ